MAFAAIALALSFAFSLTGSPVVVRTLFGVFLVCTVLVAARFNVMKGLLGLLALTGDVVFFLVLATLGSDRLLWVASVFFLYLLTEALIFFSALELVVIAGICAVFGEILPNESLHALEPTVLVAGTLACGFAVTQQRQRRTLEAVSNRVAVAEKSAKKAREEERVSTAQTAAFDSAEDCDCPPVGTRACSPNGTGIWPQRGRRHSSTVGARRQACGRAPHGSTASPSRSTMSTSPRRAKLGPPDRADST